MYSQHALAGALETYATFARIAAQLPELLNKTSTTETSIAAHDCAQRAASARCECNNFSVVLEPNLPDVWGNQTPRR